jgi:hypothetical protein
MANLGIMVSRWDLDVFFMSIDLLVSGPSFILDAGREAGTLGATGSQLAGIMRERLGIKVC